MPDFSLGLIISSFLAGVFTFFAPCTLPLIPAFLGVIAGVGPQEFQDPERVRQLRSKVFFNAIAYVVGFSLVFILFGVAFSYLGTIFAIRNTLQIVGGVLIILFGLFLMGILKISWLSAEKQIHSDRFALGRRVGLVNSFGIGALFALGWSPCVGPLLGSILLIASTSGRIVEGAFLLLVFSAGLGIPFLITALLIGKAFQAFGRWGRFLKVLNIVAGIFLIALGVLLVLGKFEYVFGQIIGFFYRFNFFEEFLMKFF